jgi:hypothetical protein
MSLEAAYGLQSKSFCEKIGVRPFGVSSLSKSLQSPERGKPVQGGENADPLGDANIIGSSKINPADRCWGANPVRNSHLCPGVILGARCPVWGHQGCDSNPGWIFRGDKEEPDLP